MLSDFAYMTGDDGMRYKSVQYSMPYRMVQYYNGKEVVNGYFHEWTRDADGEPCGIIEKKDGSIEVV
jgi:hypothetical protein